MTAPTFEQIRDRLERAVIRQIDAVAAMQAHADPCYPPRVFFMRRGANALSLWKACRRSACRRAKGCRRRHGQCVAWEGKKASAHIAWLFARGKFDTLLSLAKRKS